MPDVRTDRVVTKRQFFMFTVPMFAALLGSIVAIFVILNNQTSRSAKRDVEFCDLVRVDQLFEPFIAQEFHPAIDKAISDLSKSVTCDSKVVIEVMPTPTPSVSHHKHKTKKPVIGPSSTVTITIPEGIKPSRTGGLQSTSKPTHHKPKPHPTKSKRVCIFPSNPVKQLCTVVPVPVPTIPVPVPTIHLEGK